MSGAAMFFRVLVTECLKLKRTLALWTVFLAPLVVVILSLLVGYSAGERLIRGGKDGWKEISGNAVMMWTLLMMPLFITLETSLLAGHEHANGNWKGVLALPSPRWTVYLSKLVVTIGLLWLAHAVLVGGTLLNGLVLREIQPQLKIGALPLTPLLPAMAAISVAALFGLAIQHWVSLRCRTFTAAIGFGMFAVVTGFAVVNSAEWGPRWPWGMALHAIRPGGPGELYLMIVAAVGATVVALLGCWEFSRREIT